MIPFNKCPVCGGEVIVKEVEKLFRGGNNTAIIKIQTEVCLQCGERVYSQDTIRKFEEIREKLKKKETGEYTLLGQSFKVN